MRGLFNPLRCDIYNFQHEEFVHHLFIPDPLFRVVSTAVSNTCILFKSHMVYGEFSTLNLVEVKHIRHRHHVILMVRKNTTFVSSKFSAYSFIFGTSNFARQFYQVIIRHVHRPQIVEWRRPTNAPPENEAEVASVANAEIRNDQMDMEAESVVNFDNNNSNASFLDNTESDED